MYGKILRTGFLFLLFVCPLEAATTTLFDHIQAAIQAKDSAAYLALVSTDPQAQTRERTFIQGLLSFHSNRTVITMAGEMKGKVIAQVLLQNEDEARFQSWKIEKTVENGREVIKDRETISSIDGLFRLRIASTSYEVRNLEIKHSDGLFRLESGSLFVITANNNMAGIIFLGKGTFQFTPQDPTEQQQLTLFCKHPQLQTSLQSLYMRASTETLRTLFAPALENRVPQDKDIYERAVEIAKESDRNAFGVRVPFSEELWFPQIQGKDVYSELKTGVGTLVYQFAPNEAENVLLADKDRDRIINLYSGTGRGMEIEQQDELKILSYKMNLSYDPPTNYLSGTTDVILLNATSTGNIIFKLNPSLRVSQIDSDQGPLIYFQEKTTNNLHVVLNDSLEEGAELSLRFRYQGKINPDQGRSESQRMGTTSSPGDNDIFLPPTYLYSNQAQWYPQLVSKPYSPVDTTVTVPSGFAAIANGQLMKAEDQGEHSVYTYSSDLPVKYFSMLIGRLRGTLSFSSVVPMTVFYYTIDKNTAAKQASVADQILRFYSNYFGRYPYRSLTLALRPSDQPGGHAPASIVIANRVYSYYQIRGTHDPLFIPDYPDFLLAHEIAHQWWGQAVGWKTYRDQWLSEGFAQFAAAEYIRSKYGDAAWVKISRIFSDWIEEKTEAGPLILGTRLGHLTGDQQAFSALLYNKGGYVMNMLKNWMGAEKFTACLAEFYQLYQFKRATISDFKEVAQRYSSDDLNPFFDEWLNGWKVPEVTVTQNIGGTSEAPVLNLHFEQPPDRFFYLKIPIEVRSKDGQVFRLQAVVDQPSKDVSVSVPFTPGNVLIDPTRENLMEIYQK